MCGNCGKVRTKYSRSFFWYSRAVWTETGCKVTNRSSPTSWTLLPSAWIWSRTTLQQRLYFTITVWNVYSHMQVPDDCSRRHTERFSARAVCGTDWTVSVAPWLHPPHRRWVGMTQQDTSKFQLHNHIIIHASTYLRTYIRRARPGWPPSARPVSWRKWHIHTTGVFLVRFERFQLKYCIFFISIVDLCVCVVNLVDTLTNVTSYLNSWSGCVGCMRLWSYGLWPKHAWTCHSSTCASLCSLLDVTLQLVYLFILFNWLELIDSQEVCFLLLIATLHCHRGMS